MHLPCENKLHPRGVDCGLSSVGNNEKGMPNYRNLEGETGPSVFVRFFRYDEGRQLQRKRGIEREIARQ